MISPSDYFDLSDRLVAATVSGYAHVWDVVAAARDIAHGLTEGRRRIDGHVGPFVALNGEAIVVERGAYVESGAMLNAPCYVGAGASVRQGAYLRPGSVLFPEAIAGHATEVKDSLLLPGAQAPHFAYVGDSILGAHVNLGAGTRLSNIPITVGVVRGETVRRTIVLSVDGRPVDTGLRKLGAVLGDEVQTGCNAVLSPGTFVGPRSLIYPSLAVRRGFYPADCVVKLRQTVEVVERHDE